MVWSSQVFFVLDKQITSEAIGFLGLPFVVGLKLSYCTWHLVAIHCDPPRSLVTIATILPECRHTIVLPVTWLGESTAHNVR